MRLILILFVSSLFINGCGNYSNVRNAGPSDGGGKKVETKIDFATINREFLQDKCMTCHRHRDLYQNYSFVSRPDYLQQMIDRMETSNPVKLMPQGGPPLPAETIALFKEWVQAGAPQFNDDDKGGDDDDDDGGTDPVPDETLTFANIQEKGFKTLPVLHLSCAIQRLHPNL